MKISQMPPNTYLIYTRYYHLSIGVLHRLYVSMIHEGAILLSHLGGSGNHRNLSSLVTLSLVLEHVELSVT